MINEPLNIKDKPWYLKPVIMVLNLATLWRCSTCKESKPHVPWSGRRMGESKYRKGVCRICAENNSMDIWHKRQLKLIKEHNLNDLITFKEWKKKNDNKTGT